MREFLEECLGILKYFFIGTCIIVFSPIILIAVFGHAVTKDYKKEKEKEKK